jgi:hypothetical protein
MAKGRLEGDARPRDRPPAASVRGGDGDQHLPFCALYLVKERRKSHCSVARNRGSNTTLLASMTVEGMGPCLAVEGASTAFVFEAYIEKVSSRALDAGRWW